MGGVQPQTLDKMRVCRPFIAESALNAPQVVFSAVPILFVGPVEDEPKQASGLIGFTYPGKLRSMVINSESAGSVAALFDATHVPQTLEDPVQEGMAANLAEQIGCARRQRIRVRLLQQSDLQNRRFRTGRLFLISKERIQILHIRQTVGKL